MESKIVSCYTLVSKKCVKTLVCGAQFQEWTTSKVNELIILLLTISTDVSTL